MVICFSLVAFFGFVCGGGGRSRWLQWQGKRDGRE